jgi:uncharacterized damage-inducible protein DinB
MNNETNCEAQFIHHLTETHQHLNNAIAGLDPQVCSSEPVAGDWTIKDILGHIVSWNEEFRREIEMILHGQHPGFDTIISFENDYGDWNQQQVERKRDWPWQRILDDLETDYQMAVALVQRLKPEEYNLRGVIPWSPAAQDRPVELSSENTESIETLVSVHWWHTEAHIKDIMRWRQQKS